MSAEGAHRPPEHLAANYSVVREKEDVFGGAEGIRTPDLFNAIEARSQLRHSPTPSLSCHNSAALGSSSRCETARYLKNARLRFLSLWGSKSQAEVVAKVRGCCFGAAALATPARIRELRPDEEAGGVKAAVPQPTALTPPLRQECCYLRRRQRSGSTFVLASLRKLSCSAPLKARLGKM